eukprot:SAG31_NODE_1916_length_6929_cov_4.013324_2_plen_188_part_00
MYSVGDNIVPSTGEPSTDTAYAEIADFLTDDRAKITVDTADPFEGRYSARVLMPTSKPPIVVPLPINANLQAGNRVSVSFSARSSPAGAQISAHAEELSQDIPTPLNKPNYGANVVDVDWKRLGPFNLTIGGNTTGISTTSKAFDNSSPLQLQIQNPFSTATLVWVDDVVVTCENCPPDRSLDKYGG